MAAYTIRILLLTFLLKFVTSQDFEELVNDLKDAFTETAKESFETISDNVHEIFDAEIDEDCEYRCPEGSLIKRNESYKPSSNGCGSSGMMLDSSMLPVKSLTACCDSHDFCYSECLADKSKCDMEFRECLYATCKKHKEELTPEVFKKCNGVSKLMYMITVALGCKAYLDTQKEACICEEDVSKSGKTEL